MRTILLTATLVIVALSTASCDKHQDSKQATGASAPNPSAAHAPAGAKPGSHADWCGAHQVPESMCSRCNPSLIPAFKATNDWCEKHARPESQCLICHPELKIKRPPPPKE